MATLTPEMIEMIRALKVMPLATASADGEPNVVPVGALFVMDPETIWIGDQFMKATVNNLRENPRACIYVWGADVKGCLKIKGKVSLLSDGPDYEKMKGMVKEKKNLHCKTLLMMRITGVYDCKSGPNAGTQLL